MKEKNGITLMVLIITIIILLILARISISTLLGDNSIIQRATEAKNNSEMVSIIENLKSDIIGKQIENTGSISEDEFYLVLEKYGNVSNDKTILFTKDGNYEILISDIYNNYIKADVEKIGFYKLTFVKRYSINGGNSGSLAGEYAENITGRAASVNQQLEVNGGEIIGLSNFANNVSYAIFEFNENMEYSGGQSSKEWLSRDITLNENTKYIRIAFKKGDGTTDFTDEEVVLLPSYLEFKK